MTPTTSFGAVESVKRGDYDAFAALFAKYRRRLAALRRERGSATWFLIPALKTLPAAPPPLPGKS